jgi:hypothetical protein
LIGGDRNGQNLLLFVCWRQFIINDNKINSIKTADQLHPLKILIKMPICYFISYYLEGSMMKINKFTSVILLTLFTQSTAWADNINHGLDEYGNKSINDFGKGNQ